LNPRTSKAAKPVFKIAAPTRKVANPVFKVAAPTRKVAAPGANIPTMHITDSTPPAPMASPNPLPTNSSTGKRRTISER
jgi:hypothetical protein